MKANPYEIRQFKLASGEEILCEIIEWNNEEELELVVRKAMKLVLGEMETGIRYYSFRPWMVYQESPEDFVIINGNHVVGIGFPTDSLIKQFHEAVIDMEKMHEQRQREYNESRDDEYKSARDINKMTKKISNTSKDIAEYLNSLRDSDASNVIDMFSFNKDDMH